MKKVLISFASYKRPAGVERLLTSLEKIEVPQGLKVELLIVENDRQKTLQNVISQFKKFPIHYVLEKKSGLVHARNRILKEARNLKADFLAGLDDDETVPPKWLVNLWKDFNKYQADVVTGAQIAQFESDVPQWIKKGDFFVSESKRKSGTILSRASTGNYLLDFSFIEKHQFSFDERFNVVGSEDVDFFTQLTRKGVRIIWSKGGFVHEFIPSDRLNLLYLLKRDFRIGVGRTARRKKDSYAIAIFSAFFALIKIAFYATMLCVRLKKESFYKQLSKVTKQFGIIFGLFKGSVHVYGEKS